MLEDMYSISTCIGIQYMYALHCNNRRSSERAEEVEQETGSIIINRIYISEGKYSPINN